jgi:hypothetical protein
MTNYICIGGPLDLASLSCWYARDVKRPHSRMQLRESLVAYFVTQGYELFWFLSDLYFDPDAAQCC